MRTLDDVYGAELDHFPLEQAARFHPLELEWEDAANDRCFRIVERSSDAHRRPCAPGPIAR